MYNYHNSRCSVREKKNAKNAQKKKKNLPNVHFVFEVKLILLFWTGLVRFSLTGTWQIY